VVTCSYCGSGAHGADFCPKTAGGQGNRNALRCSYCGKRDHNRDACQKAWPGPNPVQIFDLGASWQ